MSRRVHFLGLVVFENSWEGVLLRIFPRVLHMVPVLAVYTASAPVVEITVPVLAAHAASRLLIENVVPILGCSCNTAEKKDKKGEKVRKTSLLPNKCLCAIKTNLVRTCAKIFVEIT